MSEGRKELTRSQLLVWLGQLQSPDIPLYNMVITFDIPTTVDVALFQQAYRNTAANCDSLRTVFGQHQGQPYRQVMDHIDFEFTYLDFSHLDHPEDAFAEWFNQRKKLLLDLAVCPFDTALLRLSPTRFIWYLNQHHIITDGKAVSLIFEATASQYLELCATGGTVASGNDLCNFPPARQLSTSFEEYAAYEHRLETEGRIEHARQHWEKQAKLWQALDPPCFYGHAQRSATTASDRFNIEIGPARVKKLRALATSQKFGALSVDVALFQIILTVLFAYLHRITGDKVIVVGAPSSNRTNVRQNETAGLFMQVFSLRVDFNPSDTFISLHRKVQDESLNFLRHASPGAASPESARAFNIVLNYTKVSSLRLGDVAVQQRYNHAGHGEKHHFLRLQVQEFDDTGDLLLDFDLNRGAFGHVPGHNTTEHFISTLDAFLSSPESGLKDFELLTLNERTRLLGEIQNTTADYIKPLPLHTLFETAARVHPNRQAVVSEQTKLSYQELDRQANQLAAALISAGVRCGNVVGLLLPRDTDLIIAMLAVLKTGAVYMPIDVDTPPVRRDNLLEVGEIGFIITKGGLDEDLVGRTCIDVNERGDPEVYRSLNTLENGVTFDSPAYVLFTSGSTGEPKGVVCRHRGVINLLEDFEQRNPLRNDIHCSWWTSPTFDVSVYEIYSALIMGRTLHIVPESARADGQRFLEWLSKNRIQSGYAPPFMLNEIRALLEQGRTVPPLERLLVGVEPIAENTLASIAGALPKLQIINGYGPTEATICSTLYSLPQGSVPERNTPIGRPVRNSCLYLLDQSMNLTPFGAVGEIYIGGDGLACGYLNRPNLTATHFMTNPFDSDTETRLYKTGDLAHYLPDGNLMFLGRDDHQIKLRGQRIEPGEIERTLIEHPAIRDALVIGADRQNTKQLIAYLVPHAPSNISGPEWTKWMESRLPRFMIPSDYIELEAFPLTSSGKIDKRALPIPTVGHQATAPARTPETILEQTLANIFKEVLELGSIDIDLHFLEMGGDSIRAMLIAAKAGESGIELTPRLIFEAGTVTELARILEDSPKPAQVKDFGPGKSISGSEMEDVLAEFGEDIDEDL